MTIKPTADLYDAFLDALQVYQGVLFDFGGNAAFAGPIRTLKAFEDNTKVRELLEQPGDGAVLVVDGGGSMARALVGDALGALAVANGWGGLLVHGCVRDSVELKKMALGVKALGTSPRKTEKRGQGLVDVPVDFGGVRFEPGHWLYADEDGVVVARERL